VLFRSLIVLRFLFFFSFVCFVCELS